MPLTEEQKKQQEEAKAELEAIFAASRPKNLRQGITGGVGNILGGTVGAVGVLVLAPTAGLAIGTKQRGLLGGLVGLTGGAVVGAFAAAGLLVGGTYDLFSLFGMPKTGKGLESNSSCPPYFSGRCGRWSVADRQGSRGHP